MAVPPKEKMVKLSFFPTFSKPVSNNAQIKKNVEKSPEKITKKSLNSEKTLDIITSATTGKSGLQISPVSSASGKVVHHFAKNFQIIEIGKNISPSTPNLKSNEETTPIRNSSITVLKKAVDGTMVEVGKSLPKINNSILGKKEKKP